MPVKVPNGVILIWSGTNASIPSGYSRSTSLDGKYVKGWGTGNPADTGGASAHTHNTTSTHAHSMSSHTHTITIGSLTGGSSNDANAGGSATDHQGHAGSPLTSGAASGGDLSTVSGTYSSVANDPPYYEVIFIESDGSTSVPDDVIALFPNETLPSGWNKCDTSGGSPNLVDKYLKGAATSGNSGGTGGSTNNAHSLTHTHTVSGHTHAAVNSGAADRFSQTSGGGSTHIAHSHTHSVGLASTTATIASTAPSLTTTEVVEPLHKKLLAIQNQNGSEDMPTLIIGFWLGSVGSIPSGWLLCDGTNGTPDLQDYYIKVTATGSEVGDSGGSNTHSHSSNSHTHSASASHTHTATGLTHVGAVVDGSGSDNNAFRKENYHQQSVSSTTATYGSTSTSSDSSSNEPEYVVAALIQYAGTYEISVSDGVSVAESSNVAQTHNISVSESITAEEDRIDTTIRDGTDLNVSIWKDGTIVSEVVTFPGPRDSFIYDTVSMGEDITIKVVNLEDDNVKPSFKVKI